MKVADFGLAQKVVSDECLEDKCGTLGYQAPEMLHGLKYGTKVDMFSLGVILYTLLRGSLPFCEKSKTNRHIGTNYDSRKVECNMKIIMGDYDMDDDLWDNVSEKAKDMIQSLLETDPKKRISAREALQHPWILSADEALEAIDLNDNHIIFKKFNAKSKLRQAVITVLACNRMKHSIQEQIKIDLRKSLIRSISAPIPSDFCDTKKLPKPLDTVMVRGISLRHVT